MKPWTTWLARLGIAGACFLVTGCGGATYPTRALKVRRRRRARLTPARRAAAPAPAAG